MPVANGVNTMPLSPGVSPGTISGNFAAYGALALLSIFVSLAAILFSQGGTVFAVSELYLGKETSIGQSFSRAKGEVWTLLGVLILHSLVMIVSFLLLIFPAIYMACRLCVAVPAALLENLGPREALERSFALTKDNAGRSFLIYLLYFAILYAAVALFAIPFGIGIVFSQNDPTMLRTWTALSEVGSFLAQVLITPVLTIGMSIFYFDLRVRKEAFDIQMMMNPSAGSLPAPRAAASILS
jgi:membrane-anchored glycerophosphoryl diester phosphodiesterase (GDPDase)